MSLTIGELPYPIAMNTVEVAGAKKWLESPKIKKALYGGEVALVFSAASGIGTSVKVVVKASDGTIHEQDVTDVGCW